MFAVAPGPLLSVDDHVEAIIPTERAENHASFLHRLPAGDLAAVWFAGAREGTPDVRIFLSRLDEVEQRWTAPTAISPTSERSHQNPVLATLPDGTVWLLYTAQDLGAQDTATIMRSVSDDGGHTWSEPTPLLDRTGVFIRHDLIVLPDGTLLLPAFHCHSLPGRQWFGDADTSVVLRSGDGGRTWGEISLPESTGLVHMDVVAFEDGQLVAFFRSRWADAVYRSESRDAGESWTTPAPLDVPNNNSSIQVRRARMYGPGALFAVLNPLAAEPGSELGDIPREDDHGKVVAPGEKVALDRHAVWGVGRIPLSLLLSDDRGQTWRRVRDLETEDTVDAGVLAEAGDRALEMSYPALVIDDEGTIDISYSYCRRAIKHVRLPRVAVEAP